MFQVFAGPMQLRGPLNRKPLVAAAFMVNDAEAEMPTRGRVRMVTNNGLLFRSFGKNEEEFVADRELMRRYDPEPVRRAVDHLTFHRLYDAVRVEPSQDDIPEGRPSVALTAVNRLHRYRRVHDLELRKLLVGHEVL